ncbi:MAG TPA: glycosyl hydrolase 53 family protein, partial [Cyclobacteriaceae bacterium]|nr:glycosyl hydrolase 53 family protein [Cyclobacteriaceae bacterium]
VRSIIDGLGASHNKQVVLAETAYPFTSGWKDDVHNVVGENGEVDGYPLSKQGQKNFLLKIREIVTDSPKGAGFCYWGSEWVAFTGHIEIGGEIENGSTWENQALFDFDNKALPALEAFKE